ncbi:MAG: ribonuclease R [Bacteroidales bacterium]|nr:ribonuclease R [Bacteroidales bacterium]
MSRKTKSGKQGKNGNFNREKNHRKVKGTEYEGIGQMTRDGSLFVKVDGLEEDIYVRPQKTRGALNGDLVRLVAKPSKKLPGGKPEGEVLEILERSKKPFVGVLHRMGAKAWVLMQSKSMPYDIELDTAVLASEAQSGYKVAAVVDDWPRGSEYPRGHVVDILGEMGKNDTEMHAILAEYGLPYKFDKEVADAADAISETIGPEEMKGRKDFRKTLTFTIDPADAKDFDDALSFVRLSNGNYEIGVHIADVSYYVRPGDLVDKEAQERGTSVYLVDRTVPMLPEKLSNKLCSLRPGEDKLTFSVVFEITPKGKVAGTWIGRTAINSDYRFDYETAQKIIEEGKAKRDIDDAILTIWSLASIFRNKRFKAGAISFERPEMKVECDAEGRPVAVSQHISKEANWLIEEFMLLANRTVAEWVSTGGKMDGKERKNAKTFVYRVHDTPNLEKLGTLGKFAGHFGYKTSFDGAADDRKIAHKLNDLLEEAKDKPEFYPLEMIALRSMAKASYSTDNIGHYGLAFNFYTHFTSPIRRYPDLMVHRLLARYLDDGASADKNYFEGQCVHASEREVIAANAERDSIKYKLVEYMQDKIGEEYEGHISGLTEWGMYVETEPEKVEGMVPLRSIRSDFYDFDEERYLIRGKRTRQVYRLGDTVRIKVKATNLEQRLLDYELVENLAPKPSKPFRSRKK